MIQKSEDPISTIANVIMSAVSNIVNRASFDRTVSGTVKQNLGGNVYSVEIKGTLYKMYSPLSFVLYDQVWITIPCNNFKNKFIVGKKV